MIIEVLGWVLFVLFFVAFCIEPGGALFFGILGVLLIPIFFHMGMGTGYLIFCTIAAMVGLREVVEDWLFIKKCKERRQ